MIKITDKKTKKTYKLEYTRATALEAEAQGLVLSELSFDNIPLKTMCLLSTTPFEAHHPELSENERFAILDACGNRKALTKALMSEFSAVGEAFMTESDEADEKNGAMWAVE